MKTLKNKILSGFLSLAMLISPLSSVAFAEGADTTADTPSVVYTFDASTFPIESGTTASVSVSDYGITPASTSAKFGVQSLKTVITLLTKKLFVTLQEISNRKSALL